MKIAFFDDFTAQSHDGGSIGLRFCNRIDVMVKPSADLARRLQNLAGDARGRAPDLLHSIVQPLGDRRWMTDRHIEGARRALSRLRHGPFLMQFDRITGGDSAVLRGDHHDNSSAGHFRRAVREVLRGSFPDLPNGEIDAEMILGDQASSCRGLLDQPIAWLIDEVMLVESIDGGARHVEWGRWSLSRG